MTAEPSTSPWPTSVRSRGPRGPTPRCRCTRSALLIPGAGLHEAYTLAEQLRHGVGQLRADAERRLSLSLGVTQLGGGETARDFLGRADQALRSSRAQGRNRVTVLAADERFAA